jgi:hypothetical protein
VKKDKIYPRSKDALVLVRDIGFWPNRVGVFFITVSQG